MEEILKNELAFYSKLAKPLLLNLPRSKDRMLAAAWIKKFWEENSGPEKLRTNYLKLLLFSLQRRKLVGIFADDPANYDQLEEFPLDYDLNELAKNLIEQEQEDKKEKYRKEMRGDMEVFPAFTTDCSPDLTEYVAAQDIPNFGVHCYYAISKEPINKWQQHEKAIMPKGTKSAIDTSQSPVNIATALSESRCAPTSPKSKSPQGPQPPVEGEPQGEPGTDGSSPSPAKKRKKSPKKLGKTPPSQPIGVVKTPEERLTPTWGTNLLEVRENITVGEEVKETTEDDDFDFGDEDFDLMDSSMPDFLQGDYYQQVEDVDPEALEEMRHTLEEWKREKIERRKSKLKKPGTGIPKRSGSSAARGSGIPTAGGTGIPKPGGKRGESTTGTSQTAQSTSLAGSTVSQRTIVHLDPNMTDLAPFVEDVPSQYRRGVLEDEALVCQYQDQQETEVGEREVTQATEQIRQVTPAIAQGVPVTTPKPSPSPKRPKSPERLYAQAGDDLITEEQPPLGIPPVFGRREIPEIKFTSPTPPRHDQSHPRSADPKEVAEISEFFDEVKAAVEQEEEYAIQQETEENKRRAEEQQMQYMQATQQEGQQHSRRPS